MRDDGSLVRTDEGDDYLATLGKAVPGIPGEDYPIYSEVPETSFACDGQVDGGILNFLVNQMLHANIL